MQGLIELIATLAAALVGVVVLRYIPQVGPGKMCWVAMGSFAFIGFIAGNVIWQRMENENIRRLKE